MESSSDETWPAFVLAGEDEDRIAFVDMLATIHGLLGVERERLRSRIGNLGFDGERHAPSKGRLSIDDGAALLEYIPGDAGVLR